LESLFSSVVRASSLQVAELCKLLENSFRNVNIAFINEFSRFTGVLGLNVFEIINLAATKPFGFMPFWPGTGVGGHCIPVDPYYLLEVARVNGVQLKALNESCFINANQVDWFVGRVHQLFLDMGLKPGFSTVLIAGLAYKKNVADIRNSPALSIARKLQSAGWLVKCYDPMVAECAENTDLTQFDVALKMVDHDCIQDDFLKTKAERVLSWQNVLS
ncbi:MAG: UDP binding domain-containing protein, partial [Planctomycetia bacterium]